MKKEFLERVGEFDVFSVDGSEIRKSITKEQALAGTDNTMADFLAYGVHDTLRVNGGFRQIPKGEVWIADELIPEEQDIFLQVALVRAQGLLDGLSSQAAYDNSERVARILRQNMYLEPAVVSTFRVDGDITTYIVNGFNVRNWHSTRFIQGGHGMVYDYIPDDAIWIDNTLDPDEYLAVFVHEFVERNLMEGGIKYEDAHEVATLYEYECRETGEVPEIP